MANEIQFSVMLNANKLGNQISRQFSMMANMAGINMLQGSQSIPTGGAAISFGSIGGVPKKVLVVNLDQTNYVEIDSANTFDKFPQKLQNGSNNQPGDFILLSPETGVIYARANTAAVTIAVLAVEA